MPESDDRRKLLLQMYDQMFNDIDTHIKVVWQSVAVLIGAFAIFSLTEKKVISIDMASALVVLIAGWLLANLYDAGYWYNRNLGIIANIEKEFLLHSDLRDVHYYFGSHRPENKMFKHLEIQFAFGLGLGGIVLVWHFLERILPGMQTASSLFDPGRALPYVALLAAFLYLRVLRRTLNDKYAEFLRNSPGKSVSTEGIQYGVGHGFPSVTGPGPG
jgi:hypothetical protein